MKAEVTAENKPAYSPRKFGSKHEQNGWRRKKTNEDQSHIQITATFLHKIAVVDIRLALEVAVERRACVGRFRVERKVGSECLE